MTIKQLREAAHMTQKAFAEYFGIPKRTIENWEGGKNQCPEYLLRLLEYRLGNEGKLAYRWTLAKWAGRDIPANVDDLIWEANDIISAYAESNPEYGEPELKRLSDSMWECYCELGIVGEKEELFEDA